MTSALAAFAAIGLGNATLWTAAAVHHFRQTATLRHQLAQAIYSDAPTGARLVLPEDRIRAAFRTLKGADLSADQLGAVNLLIGNVRRSRVLQVGGAAQ